MSSQVHLEKVEQGHTYRMLIHLHAVRANLGAYI